MVDVFFFFAIFRRALTFFFFFFVLIHKRVCTYANRFIKTQKRKRIKSFLYVCINGNVFIKTTTFRRQKSFYIFVRIVARNSHGPVDVYTRFFFFFLKFIYRFIFYIFVKFFFGSGELDNESRAQRNAYNAELARHAHL